jgi:hypothetical protein
MPYFVRWGLLALLLPLGCGPAEGTSDDGDDSGGEAITSSATQPKRVTKFASGEVDLTTYKSAGPTEWSAFEQFYKSRHTKADQRDWWDTIVARTKPPAGEEAKINGYVALKGYTAETAWFFAAKVDQDYKLINTTLREADGAPTATTATTLANIEGYVKSAASALNALPPVTGTVHRRVYRANCDAACVQTWLGAYAPNMFVREPSFVSTSSKEAPTCFFRGQLHLVIEAGGAAHMVQTISDMPQEEEAIFPPNTVFKIDRVETDKDVVCDMSEGWEPQLTTPKLQPPPKETIVFMHAVTN